MSQPEEIQFELPRYYLVGITPVKIFRTEDNLIKVEKLSLKTGLFEPALELLSVILHGKGDDVDLLNEEQFIGAVENLRMERFADKGVVAPLYALIKGMIKTSDDENRPLTENELNIIRSIRRKTYNLFETVK